MKELKILSKILLFIFKCDEVVFIDLLYYFLLTKCGGFC